MVQDAKMDAMDNVVRPKPPVTLGPHVVLRPGGALEQGAAAGQRKQPELPMPGNEEAVEMRRTHILIWSPFLQGSWIRCDREFQEMRRVPNFNRLDKGAGREFAAADGPRTRALDPGANGIGYAEAEKPFLGRREFSKSNHVFPNGFRGSFNLDGTFDLQQRRGGSGQMLRPHGQGNESKDGTE